MVKNIPKSHFMFSKRSILFILFSGGGFVKNKKNLISYFVRVLCYFQHFRKKIVRRGGGGGFVKKISLHVL